MSGSISAKVIDVRNNQPISGATVATITPQAETTTSAGDGSIKLANLKPANDYVMQVSATGYLTENYEDIVVLDNNDTNLGMLALWSEED